MKILILALSICFLLCSSLFAQTPTPTPPQRELQAYFDATAKWPVEKGKLYEKGIPVCWENPADSMSKEMSMVKNAIEMTWQANSAVLFRGWQKCSGENGGIHILIDDSGPHTKGLGVYLDKAKNGMVLNFMFNNWSPACKDTPDIRNFCIKSIAVHEFGHALGYAHEHNRSDRPGECTEAPQGGNGTVFLTPYDPSSVMNYCNPVYNNNGILSKLDVVGLQKIYGPPKNSSQTKNKR